MVGLVTNPLVTIALGLDGEAETNSCPPARLAFQLDFAGTLLNETQHPAETKPVSVPRLLRREEGVEGLLQDFPRHAAAIIADGDLQPRRIRLCDHGPGPFQSQRPFPFL